MQVGMYMIEEYSIVRAKKDLSNMVRIGCKGAVVMVYQVPVLGYEVEFMDKDGETLEILTVYPDDIEI